MTYQTWYTAPKGEVAKHVFEYVETVEQSQFDIFDRFVKLAALYDPNATTAERTRAADQAYVVENVIASNVDTVTAVVAATDVRARFMTDDGDWSTQRTAKWLEWYAGELGTRLGVGAACRAAFKDAAIKGTGLLHVFIDEYDEIKVERVLVDDIIVDEKETQNGAPPRQMHRRRYVDRDELVAQFPEHERAIRAAQGGDMTGSRRWVTWAGYRPIEENEVVVLESWRLPLGRRPKENVKSPHDAKYRVGRHVISVDNCDLVDEDWHKPHFPFARIVWSERVNGWYGISGAERIAGHQRTLNKRNLQIDRQLDQGAFPTTFVPIADAAMAVKQTNRVGTIVVTKSGKPPTTVIPQAVSGETYQNRNDTKASAFEEFGVSRMAASAAKPAGIDSGVAMREYRDQTTQRFALQEKGFEQLNLDAIWLILDCCKDLGAAAPTVMRRTHFGERRIPWARVDMGDVRVQIAAASTLGRTPAGRTQLVLELAQAGIVSQDSARRLLQHPDIERELSLYTAALENIEECLEEIADGNVVTPEPYMNMRMCVWRGQQQYLLWRRAPEEVLEDLRAFIVQAADGVAKIDEAEMAMTAPQAQPQAALAPEAMNLQSK